MYASLPFLSLIQLPARVCISGVNKRRQGDLSLHYLRWLPFQGSRSTGQVILEMAFWLGPIVGVRNDAVRERYRDRSHTAAADRWIVFHLHIALDENTFWGETAWNVGITTVGVYHAQNIARPTWVTPGRAPDFRADWRYSSSYSDTNNRGQFRDYNSRTEMTCGNFNRNRRLYIGPDRRDAAQSLSSSQIADNPYLEGFLGLVIPPPSVSILDVMLTA
jgi:chitinase